MVFRSEKLLEAERFQPIHGVALGFLVLLLGRRCNLLAKATGFPVLIREWVQRAVCHLQSCPGSLEVCQYIRTSVNVRKSAKGLLLTVGYKGDRGVFGCVGRKD